MKLFSFIAVVCLSLAANSQSRNPGNAVDGYSLWHDLGLPYLDCRAYPDVGAPKDPNFKPDKYRWPAFGGIKQNKRGPYNEFAKCELPDAGITVGGGKYGWASAGLVRTVSKAQMDESLARRRMASSAQKQVMLELEAQNSNWTYSMQANGIRIEPIDFDVRCVYAHVNFVTKDGKYYYHNFYRYLGIIPEDARYIPTIQLKDYLTPDQLRAELAKMGCLKELY